MMWSIEGVFDSLVFAFVVEQVVDEVELLTEGVHNGLADVMFHG